MIRSIPPVFVLMLLALSACAPQPSNPADSFSEPLVVPDAGAVVARVGDVEIRHAWLQAMAHARGLDLSDPQQRGRALDELVEYAVLIAAARGKPELAASQARAELELSALAGRATAVLGRLGVQGEPDEARLRAEYEQQSAINGDHEYQVGHLLFADETLAEQAAQRLNGGLDFAGIQSEYQDRAQQAGDLGWIKLGQLPEEFAAALRQLPVGHTTVEPVRTSYGWHIIHLRQTRPFQPPPFEQVREGIRRMLVAQSVKARVEELKAQARIEIVSP